MMMMMMMMMIITMTTTVVIIIISGVVKAQDGDQQRCLVNTVNELSGSTKRLECPELMSH
jgi:hypothetical protein